MFISFFKKRQQRLFIGKYRTERKVKENAVYDKYRKVKEEAACNGRNIMNINIYTSGKCV